MKKLIRGLLLLSTILWLVPTLFSVLGFYLEPSLHWIPVIFALGFPFILAINVLFFLLWLMMGYRKRALIPLLAILAGWPQIRATFGLSLMEGTPTKDRTTLKVMSYNVHRFNIFTLNEEVIRKARRGMDYVIKQDPDILCLQEAQSYRKEILDYLKRNTKMKHSYRTGRGNTIFSKYPIVGKKFEIFPKTGNSVIYTDLEIAKGKIVRVLNVHFESHRFEGDDYTVFKKPSFKKKTAWQSVLRKVYWATIRRANQAEIVKKYIKNSPHPVILCGDFNDTPSTYTYRSLSPLLNDSFVAKGFGMGFSYAGPIPGLRIDYVMADENFRFLSHEVSDYEFSDHYPLIVKLEL